MTGGPGQARLLSGPRLQNDRQLAFDDVAMEFEAWVAVMPQVRHDKPAFAPILADEGAAGVVHAVRFSLLDFPTIVINFGWELDVERGQLLPRTALVLDAVALSVDQDLRAGDMSPSSGSRSANEGSQRRRSS